MYILMLISMKRYTWLDNVPKIEADGAAGSDPEEFEVARVLREIEAEAEAKNAEAKQRPIHYTNMVIYNIDHSQHPRSFLLEQFANSLHTIAYLRAMGVNPDHCNYIEQLFYANLPQELRRYLRVLGARTWRELTAHIASVCMDPDHTWRTGQNAGQTTMEIMKRQFVAHTSQ